ncbi:MAG: peptidoglycan binding domain-containing protein [bacterium]|nr:peptidoglycan binding domain-containing protein [bacterium]
MSKKELNRTKISGNTKKIVFGCVGLLLGILIIAYLCVSQFYKDHFYAQTFINGLDCSNLTAEEAKELISQNVNTYVLTVKGRNDVTEKISGADIGLQCTFDQDFNEVLESQSAYSWLSNTWKHNKVDNPYTLSYDEDKLTEIISKLEFLKKKNQVAPKNATISEYDEQNGFTIIAEEQGSKLTKKKLTQVLKSAIENLDGELVLDEADCYEKPTITSDDQILQTAMKTIDKYMSTKLTYTFGDKTEIFDGTKIGPAIKVDDEGTVTLDESKIEEFVAYIRKTYNTVFSNRQFMTSYGKTITTQGGDYGWWLNANGELKEILECIKNGEQKDKQPVYIQTAVQYGDNDLGDSYVEINLSAQHLFVYKDGKKVLETDFVSGSVVKGYETPAGVFPIQYKETDATLKGQGYNTPVKYWMPFNRNIGMHDASWKSSFGGSQFINNGSHGCINLPPAMAEKIFGYVEKGMPVVCYHLSGTESYNVKQYESAKSRAPKSAQ